MNYSCMCSLSVSFNLLAIFISLSVNIFPLTVSLPVCLQGLNCTTDYQMDGTPDINVLQEVRKTFEKRQCPCTYCHF